jgi:FtsZ-interacting cell division protein ZipA
MQENNSIILIVAVAVVVAALVAWAMWRMQKRRALARKYGAEYQRLAHKGDPDRAVRELEQREARVSRFKLRELAPAQREEYLARWNGIQSAFVDEPARAAQEAHLLLADVMRDLGYPETDLAQRQKDLSVSYPELIEPYREACEIASRRGGAAGASTENLRRATIVYRSLIEALLDRKSGGPSRHKREVA